MKTDKKNEPLLLDHEVDGIKELDNLLPRWWVWLFHLSVIFSVGYMLYYHVFRFGDLQVAAFEKELEKGEKIKAVALANFESSLGELSPSNDNSVIEKGQETYVSFCAPCHRDDGGGQVGPNLCDDYWIHGPNYADNVKVILNGVPEKGMLSWRGVLKPGEIQAVASFVYTFRGTSPPNPKPPENQQAPEAPSLFE